MKQAMILLFSLLTFTGHNSVFSQEEIPAVITEGQLTVSVSTSATSTPTYAPSHILAIYVLDSQVRFVKTLLAYAAERKQYLVNWKNVTTVAGSPYNTVDAVTGATQKSHSTRTCTWNGKNRSGVSVDDGTYTVRMELTDNDGNRQNLASFNINKGPAEVTLTPAATNGFSNISIRWKPVNTAIESINDNNELQVIPNQEGTQLTIKSPDFKHAELYEINGRLLISSLNPTISISNLPKGNYLVVAYDNKNKRLSKTYSND